MSRQKHYFLPSFIVSLGVPPTLSPTLSPVKQSVGTNNRIIASLLSQIDSIKAENAILAAGGVKKAMISSIEVKKEWKMFGGLVKQCNHESSAVKTPKRFSVFLPPQAENTKVPTIYWLSGLTCTDDNFTQKACAQYAASKHGICVVAPDTSPRGAGIEGEDDGWDFGTGLHSI